MLRMCHSSDDLLLQGLWWTEWYFGILFLRTVQFSLAVMKGVVKHCTLCPFLLFATVQQKSGEEEYVYLSGTGSLLCGSLAGICAKTFVYPFDVARKRLQIQGFQHGRVGFGKVRNISSSTDIWTVICFMQLLLYVAWNCTMNMNCKGYGRQ